MNKELPHQERAMYQLEVHFKTGFTVFTRVAFSQFCHMVTISCEGSKIAGRQNWNILWPLKTGIYSGPQNRMRYAGHMI